MPATIIAIFISRQAEKMIEQLYPCDHCGGRPTLGYSQRVVAQIGESGFDYGRFGREAGPPVMGDTIRRPLGAPQTERLVCVHCGSCGMQTPWVAVKDNDEHAAMTECGLIWNNRLSRPPVNTGDLRDLVEKELGACDSQLVIDLLARNEGEWEERGPILKMLAQRLIDAAIVTIDSWPIDPVLKDAARYRKLVQLAKWVDIDGERYVSFPRIPTPPEHTNFLFEDRIAIAVDAMPDRNRW
ncbi:Lar family restriction alleviation protein [Paraburkholderia nemoris]